VAHTAVTYMMNFSLNMFEQQRMLQRGDRSNFTVSKNVLLVSCRSGVLLSPHFSPSSCFQHIS
jgi:hypothetical protein